MEVKMKKLLVLLLLLLAFSLFSSCSLFGPQPHGACVFLAGCGDDYTEGKCSMMNGHFYEGKTCADLGY
jgi:hypothetical protein